MDGPTEVSLDNMHVGSVDELLALPTGEIAKRLGDASFPASEKLIGAVLLVAVDRLKGATADLAQSSREMEQKASTQIKAAWLTLAVAFVSLIVALIAAVR